LSKNTLLALAPPRGRFRGSKRTRFATRRFAADHAHAAAPPQTVAAAMAPHIHTLSPTAASVPAPKRAPAAPPTAPADTLGAAGDGI
jgi:hypothetical protein